MKFLEFETPFNTVLIPIDRIKHISLLGTHDETQWIIELNTLDGDNWTEIYKFEDDTTVFKRWAQIKSLLNA